MLSIFTRRILFMFCKIVSEKCHTLNIDTDNCFKSRRTYVSLNEQWLQERTQDLSEGGGGKIF